MTTPFAEALQVRAGTENINVGIMVAYLLLVAFLTGNFYLVTIKHYTDCYGIFDCK